MTGSTCSERSTELMSRLTCGALAAQLAVRAAAAGPDAGEQMFPGWHRNEATASSCPNPGGSRQPTVAPQCLAGFQESAVPDPGSVRPGWFEQPLDSDRQVADPGTGSVEDGVGDGRGHPDRAEFAYALGAERAGMRVRVVD